MKSNKHKDLHFDFSIVRNVMYLYSKKAQEHFMTYPVECFFLAQFYNSAEGKRFIQTKPDSEEKAVRILSDTEILRDHAVQSLSQMGTSISEELVQHLSKTQ